MLESLELQTLLPESLELQSQELEESEEVSLEEQELPESGAEESWGWQQDWSSGESEGCDAEDGS